MHPAPPALHELALQLRYLRMEHWSDTRLTQSVLAGALARQAPLSSATVASWESRTAPKLPPRDRMVAYAQFFATRRSLGPPVTLVSPDTFTPEEQAAYQELLERLLRLQAAARNFVGREVHTLNFRNRVRGRYHRGAVFDCSANQRCDNFDAFVIQRRERFVEQQQRRLGKHRARGR